MKWRVRVEISYRPSTALSHTGYSKSYSGKSIGTSCPGRCKLRSQLHLVVAIHHTETYVIFRCWNLLSYFLLFIEIQYLQKKCIDQNNLLEIASFICSSKNSEHRGRKVSIEMEENLPMFMKINSLSSTIICNLTFNPEPCSSSLYLRGLYE